MDRDVLDQPDNVVPLRRIPTATSRLADHSDATSSDSVDAWRGWQLDGVGAEIASVFAADDTGGPVGAESLGQLDVADVVDRYGLPRAVPFNAEALDIADPDVDVCDQAVTNIQVGLLYRHLRGLPEAEATALRLAYGLGGKRPLAEHEIAARMDTSPAEVRTLVRRAVERLRELHVAGSEAA